MARELPEIFYRQTVRKEQRSYPCDGALSWTDPVPNTLHSNFQPPNRRSGALSKYGKRFWFDRLGDVRLAAWANRGCSFENTRHLSELMVLLWGTRPLLLSSTVETGNFLLQATWRIWMFRVTTRWCVPRGTLHVVALKFLWNNTCYEEIELSSWLSELSHSLRTTFDAELRRYFRIAADAQAQRGNRLPPEMDLKKQSVLPVYRGWTT